MIYPAWRYHREHDPKLIHSEEEENPAWHDNPGKVGLIPFEANGRMEFAKSPSEAPAAPPAEKEKKKPGPKPKEKVS